MHLLGFCTMAAAARRTAERKTKTTKAERKSLFLRSGVEGDAASRAWEKSRAAAAPPNRWQWHTGQEEDNQRCTEKPTCKNKQGGAVFMGKCTNAPLLCVAKLTSTLR